MSLLLLVSEPSVTAKVDNRQKLTMGSLLLAFVRLIMEARVRLLNKREVLV